MVLIKIYSHTRSRDQRRSCAKSTAKLGVVLTFEFEQPRSRRVLPPLMPCFRVSPFVFGLAVLLIIARSQANYRVLLSARPDHPAQRLQQDASLRCLMVSAISVQVVCSLRSALYGAGSCGLAECWWAWVERLSRLLKIRGLVMRQAMM
jgi:hypothetical protein